MPATEKKHGESEKQRPAGKRNETAFEHAHSATQARIDRGLRLVELLKQPQYQPMPVEEQVASLYSATRGFLDDIPVTEIRRFETEFLEYMRTSQADIMNDIKTKKEIDADLDGRLKNAIEAFKSSFKS